MRTYIKYVLYVLKGMICKHHWEMVSGKYNKHTKIYYCKKCDTYKQICKK